MTVVSDRAFLLDFAAVELPGKREHGSRLAQTRERIDGDAALDLVAILLVAVDDVPQVLVERRHLRCLQRPEVGVVLTAVLVVFRKSVVSELAELAAGEQLGLRPGRGLSHTLEALLPRKRQVIQLGPKVALRSAVTGAGGLAALSHLRP